MPFQGWITLAERHGFRAIYGADAAVEHFFVIITFVVGLEALAEVIAELPNFDVEQMQLVDRERSLFHHVRVCQHAGHRIKHELRRAVPRGIGEVLPHASLSASI